MSNPLGYEPHSNLLFNLKSADQCDNLGELRYEIDRIDHLIIKLMSFRLSYALATLKFKSNGKPIPDDKRIVEALKQRRIWAKEYYLEEEFIENWFKQMIDWIMKQQILFYKKQNPNEKDIQIKFSSLSKLKSFEYNLNWIEIDQFNHCLDLASQQVKQINQSLLLSFTQNIPKEFYSNFIRLFESNQENVFVLNDISILSFGNEIQLNYETIENEFKTLKLNLVRKCSDEIVVDRSGPFIFVCSFSSCHASFILPRVQFIKNNENISIILNQIVPSHFDNQYIEQYSISILNFVYNLFENNSNENLLKYSINNSILLLKSENNQIECLVLNSDSINQLKSLIKINSIEEKLKYKIIKGILVEQIDLFKLLKIVYSNCNKTIIGLIDFNFNSLFEICLE